MSDSRPSRTVKSSAKIKDPNNTSRLELHSHQQAHEKAIEEAALASKAATEDRARGTSANSVPRKLEGHPSQYSKPVAPPSSPGSRTATVADDLEDSDAPIHNKRPAPADPSVQGASESNSDEPGPAPTKKQKTTNGNPFLLCTLHLIAISVCLDAGNAFHVQEINDGDDEPQKLNQKDSTADVTHFFDRPKRGVHGSTKAKCRTCA